jgi:hypothetical protein
LHHPLSFSDGNVRILRAIVEPLMGAVFDLRHDLALGGGVGAEFVGDDPLRRTGIVMSGWRPLIKGYFGVALVVGAVMSSAFRADDWIRWP